jgi:hypothetical protein
MADAIAQAATRSVIKGNSFGDNLLASLPSALGNLAGSLLAEQSGITPLIDGKSSKDHENAAGTPTPPVPVVKDAKAVETPVGEELRISGADRDVVIVSSRRLQNGLRDPDAIYLPGHPLYDPVLDGAGLSYNLEFSLTRSRIYETDKAARQEARLAAELAAVETNGIIVEARPASVRRKGETIGYGDYPSQKTGPGGTWHGTFTDMAQSYNGTMSAYLTYLDPNRSSPEWLAQLIWDEDGYWAAESFTLPLLDSMAEHQMEFGKVAAILRGKLTDLHDRSSAETNKLAFAGLLGPAAIAAGGAFTPIIVSSGSTWLQANTALGATSSQFVSGGAVGYTYTEAGTRMFQGRAPTWGERIGGTVTGGVFASGLVGVNTGKPILDGAINGGLSGSISDFAGQNADIWVFGQDKSFDWTKVVLAGAGGTLAGGVGGTVVPYYARTPSLGNSQTFKAGWNYGIRMQINGVPATAVSIMVQAHADLTTGERLNPTPNPPPKGR